MAKKKVKPEAPAFVVSPELLARQDEAFGGIWKAATARDGREDDIVGDARSLPCLPFPSLLLRYLFKLEGFPLCRVYQMRGPRASYKTTFGTEIARWHRLYGGYGARVDTEHKDNPLLTDMLLGYDSKWFQTYSARSVEDWQTTVTHWFEGVRKWCLRAQGPGRTVPVCMLVDSLAGNLSERTMKNIREAGHAVKRFPEEAASLTDYIKFIPQEIAGWPFTFIGINHRKLDLSSAALGVTKYRSPGGEGYGYHMSFGIDMEKVKTQQFADRFVATVRMLPEKNSYGPEYGKIEVDLSFWQQEDRPEGQEDGPGIWRDYCRFEWWAGSIYLLSGQFFNATQAELWQDKLKEVVDVHEKTGGPYGKLWWSKALGIDSSDAMPASDLGELLETRHDLLAQLYDILRIQRMHFFRPSISFVTQMDEYAYMLSQADSSTEARGLKAALGPGEHRPPIRRPPTEAEA
jgi:hypothetical protein